MRIENNIAVFVSNLRTLDDMTQLFPVEWHARVHDARDNEGFIASPPFDILGRGTGHLVLMLRSGEEVMADPDEARRITFDMTRYAEEALHADTIGLGSLTASITKGGTQVRDLIDANGWHVRATHGDSGTVAMLVDLIERAAPPGSGKRIAVIGAYGVIGASVSRVLAARGHDLVLHGRSAEKLLDLTLQMASDAALHGSSGRGGAKRTAETTTNLEDAVAAGDVIVTVTSHPTSLLSPDMLKPGAIVIDPAVPANTRNDPGYATKGITVISNACQVRVPGVDVTSAMFGTYADPDGAQTTYACMAETWLDAVNGERRHLVGSVDPADVALMRTRFAHAGFAHATPRMFGAFVSL